MEEHGHVVMFIALKERKMRKHVLHDDDEPLWNCLIAFHIYVPVSKQVMVCGYKEDVRDQHRNVRCVSDLKT